MTTPEFYDEAYMGTRPDYENSRYRPLYDEAARWFPSGANVIDLGCGIGEFAQCLFYSNFRGDYVGVDFSPIAIDWAMTLRLPSNFRFKLRDLTEWELPTPSNGVYVCFETLEHLEDDLGLVAKIPPGERLIFSVPGFDSTYHLRYFPTMRSIWDRYFSLVSFRRWSLIQTSERGVIHLLDTARRADAW